MNQDSKPAADAAEVVLSRPLGPTGVDRGSHLGFVAHEVRNPLSTAMWSAELMARFNSDERSGERGTKLALLGSRALGRIQVLVEDHLLCERLDEGGYPLRLATVEVAPLLQAVVARLSLAPTPELQLAPGLRCRGDRPLLERAIEGVVAVAGRHGVQVQVGGELGDGLVRLRVRGAPVEELGDPVKGSPSDPGGRALSLPMARRVAAVHGGSLAADGEGYLLVFPAT